MKAFCRRTNGALIVNVSSGLAFIPFPASPVYCATKAAIHSFTQSLRVQLEGMGVAVVELAPPAVETPLLRGEFAEEMKEQKGIDVMTLARHAIAGIESGKLEIRPRLANVLIQDVDVRREIVWLLKRYSNLRPVS
jgi:uncharacterized oxidoreductase